MNLFRAVLVASSVLALSAQALSAQGGKVTCKDGSKSAGGRGACSGHGGVMTAAMKAAAKAEAKAVKAEKKAEVKAEAKAVKAETKTVKAEAKTVKAEKKAEVKAEKKAEVKAEKKADDNDARGATAECKDHTYSHAKSRQGACAAHGGVAKFLTGAK